MDGLWRLLTIFQLSFRDMLERNSSFIIHERIIQFLANEVRIYCRRVEVFPKKVPPKRRQSVLCVDIT